MFEVNFYLKLELATVFDYNLKLVSLFHRINRIAFSCVLEERVVNVIQDQILTPDLMEWLTNLSHLIQF